MQQRIKVLYFTRVNLDRPHNGGVLVCRNHIRRLAQDPRLIVTLCNAGSINQLSETEAFATSIGAPLDFIPFQRNPPRLTPRWPITWELEALAQSHIDDAVLDAFKKMQPAVVVIDYLFSALYVPSLFSAPVRKVVITLNRELEFYRELKTLRGLPPDPSEDRLLEFERSIYQRCDAVVTLAAADIPTVAADKGWVIPPLFDPARERWSYSGNARAVFVGNINHYPNFQAVEWIATCLAPMLELMRSTARISIIGASANDVPPAWRRQNVSFLGIGDAALVTTQLVESDLFLAPIVNSFGSKIKLLDCLAHGTPFIATQEALSGISFLEYIPRIQVDQPRKAAEVVSALLQDGPTLSALSDRLARQLSDALNAQKGIWSNLFENILAADLPPMQKLPAPQPHDLGWGKVSRNEPCPCGSGKRYKHCHGQLA